MALHHPKLEVIVSETLGGPLGTTGLRICSLLKPAMRRAAIRWPVAALMVPRIIRFSKLGYLAGRPLED